MYKDKATDHEKRKNEEGSYSLYNHLYNKLLRDYEPANLMNEESCRTVEAALIGEGKEYAIKGGKDSSDKTVTEAARKAMENFIKNKKSKSGDAEHLGRSQKDTFENIKRTIADLKY